MKKVIYLLIGCVLSIACSKKSVPDVTATLPEEAIPTVVGKTYYVDASIAASGNGLTEIAAFKTLTEAANATTAGDFRLRTGSPAIDFGQNSLYFPKKDIMGNTRPKGKEADCGAYEIE